MNEKIKKLIRENGLNPDNWRVLYESKTDVEIQHRRGQRRVLEKKRRKK